MAAAVEQNEETISKPEGPVTAVGHPLKTAANNASQDPPVIPHITNNYVSLATILSNVVFHCYAELQTVLETLPSVTSDLARKRRVLNYIVSARQQLVKVYVLLKWAAVSQDISRCIDVVSWLTGQQNCFTNLVNVLFDVDRNLSGAKLRNSDIETALEVYKYGQPVQKWNGFKPPKPLSGQAVLKTLRDLNVLLSIRLALTEDLAPRYRQYEINDGRVKFTIDNSFVVDLGIADDSTEARFFLVDFYFIFDGTSTIPMDVKMKVEKFTNDMLTDQPLDTVFDWLLRFTQNYKLSHFHQQLTTMAQGFWSGFINHVFYPDKSLIVIQYWINRLGSKNIIEIGLLSSNSIGVRWLREGAAVPDHGVEFGQTNMDVEKLVLSIIDLHIAHTVQGIHRNLCHLVEDKRNKNPREKEAINQQGLVSLIPTNRLRIQLTGTRHTTLSIDPLSGRTVLNNPTQLILAAERSLNELIDLTNQGADILFKLRFISIQEEIITRAKAAGWVANNNVQVSHDEMKRYFSEYARIVFSLRLPSWPLSWFLLVSICTDSPPKWWLSRLQSKDKAWTITFLESIHVDQERDYIYDYNLFDDLSIFTTSRFKIQLLASALDAKNVQYNLFKVGKRPNLPAIMVNLKTLMKFSWARSSLFITLEDEKNILVQGKAKKSLESLNSMPSTSDGVVVDPANGKFALKIPFDDESDWSQFVDVLCRKLSRVERVVSYVELIKSMSLELVDASMKKITFAYGPGLSATIGWKDDGVINLELSPENPHLPVVSSLEAVLNDSGLLSMVHVLQNTLSLYRALGDFSSSSSSSSPPPIVVCRNVSEVKLIYPVSDVRVEIRIMRYKQSQVVYFSESTADSLVLKDVWERPGEGIVPLLKGLTCDFDKVSEVLKRIQQVLDSNYITIE